MASSAAEAEQQAERDQRGAEVEHDGHEPGSDEAEIPDQQPAARQRSSPGAEGVQPVEPANPLRCRIERGGDSPRQQRQGSAHQGRRHHQPGEAQREHRRRGVHHARQFDGQPIVEERLGQQREARDPRFAERESEQRAGGRQPVGQLRPDQAADAQTHEEGADHQRRADGVGAGEDAEHALPDHLADQGAEAGAEEGRRQAHHHRGCSSPLRRRGTARLRAPRLPEGFRRGCPEVADRAHRGATPGRRDSTPPNR